MKKSGKIIGLRKHDVAGKTIYGPGDIGKGFSDLF
jgi:hypothetical protein